MNETQTLKKAHTTYSISATKPLNTLHTMFLERIKYTLVRQQSKKN